MTAQRPAGHLLDLRAHLRALVFGGHENGQDRSALRPSLEQRRIGWVGPQGLHEQTVRLRGMKVRVVLHAVREKIAAIWRFRAEAVQTRSQTGTAQERDDGRGAGEELHIDDGIDTCLSDSPEHAQDIDDEP